jgi:hypothetical protein
MKLQIPNRDRKVEYILNEMDEKRLHRDAVVIRPEYCPLSNSKMPTNKLVDMLAFIEDHCSECQVSDPRYCSKLH